MTITASTVFITSTNNPYVLGSGNTISINSSNDPNHAGEAIYTDLSPTNATTIGGATITIDGVVIDNSVLTQPDEYAIQSKSAADATLFNYGTIDSTHLVAVGFNNGLIVNERGGTIMGAGGIRIGGGSLMSTIMNYGDIIATNSAGIGFLSPSAPAVIYNASTGYIRGGLTGGQQAESGIYNLSGTITNAGTIAAGGAAGDAINFFGTAGHDALILDPGQVLEGAATAAGTGNMLILGGTGLGDLSNPGSYLGFTTMSVATGADWQIGTAGSTVSISGISTIHDFGTLNIAGAIANTAIDMEGSVAGTATEVDFTGASSVNPLIDYGANDQIVFGTLTGGPGTTYQDSYDSGTGLLTVTEINAAGQTVGSASASVTGVPGQPSLTSADFVDINGPNGETIVLGSSTLANQGSIYLDYGESATLNNTAGVDTVPVTFGSHQSALGVLNTLDIDGSVSGTDSPYQGAITGFGLNDDIILGPSTLPSLTLGGEVSLSYAGSLLSVTEFDSNGASIGSTTLDVGAGYDPNSFVALLGADGVNLETADTVDEQPLTFNASGTANFETTTDYSGGLAPGSSIVAGETVIIASGTAAVSMTAPITDSGTIIVSGASSGFVDTSPLSGNGVLDLQDGAAATIAAPSSLSDIDMGGNNAGTSLDLLGNFVGDGHTPDGPTITNFGTTDSILLNGFTSIAGDQLITYFNTATGVLSMSEYNFGSGQTDESAVVTIAAPGGAMLIPGQIQESFGPNGLIITDMPCFAAGTRILTPNGERRVESLAAGDEVLTARDGSAQTIIWTGSRTIDISRHANPEKVIPVLILAGAFGDGLPERDLRLSPDHALFIDGHLIEAKTLVNGATVIRDRGMKFVTYHHIELERHDVILAEGLPAETYLDSGNRQNFQTDAGPLALHPDFAAKARDAACATLLTDGEIVRAARQNLLNRAATLGFTTTDVIELTAKASGERIEPQIDQTGRNLMFVLPASATSVSLLSATGVPAEILADPSDRRILGVAITGLALITGGSRVEIDLHNPAHTGLHGAEAGGSWTNGHAVIALPAYEGGAMLEVTLAGQAARWQQNRMAQNITAM
jgi:hypothetical protein